MSDLKFATAGDYSDYMDAMSTISDSAMVEQLRNWSTVNVRLEQIADRFEALVEKAARHEVLLEKVEKYSAQMKQTGSE
tara:strand:- start:259 stop:495 length:237 start_codon:yes stop_codon:yes gene_type:complete